VQTASIGLRPNRMAVSLSSLPDVHVDHASTRHHHRMQCRQQLHSRVQSFISIELYARRACANISKCVLIAGDEAALLQVRLPVLQLLFQLVDQLLEALLACWALLRCSSRSKTTRLPTGRYWRPLKQYCFMIMLPLTLLGIDLVPRLQ
jgi:hypothetical protein